LINADEVTLFEAMLKWSEKECLRRGVDATPDKKRQCLGEALFLIRYLTLSAKDFAQGPAKSGKAISILNRPFDLFSAFI